MRYGLQIYHKRIPDDYTVQSRVQFKNDLDFKLRLLSIFQVKSVVLVGFIKQIILSFGYVLYLQLSLTRGGLNFCKQTLKYGNRNFFLHFKI